MSGAQQTRGHDVRAAAVGEMVPAHRTPAAAFIGPSVDTQVQPAVIKQGTATKNDPSSDLIRDAGATAPAIRGWYWTNRQVATLRRMVADGASGDAIAAATGRTRRQVHKKVQAMRGKGEAICMRRNGGRKSAFDAAEVLRQCQAGIPRRQIAKALRTSEATICRLVKGVLATQPTTWSAEQQRELLAMQATHSYAEIAAALGRTRTAVMRKVSAMRAQGQDIPDARKRKSELMKARWAAAVQP